jgi:hypothetical protein
LVLADVDEHVAEPGFRVFAKRRPQRLATLRLTAEDLGMSAL